MSWIHNDPIEREQFKHYHEGVPDEQLASWVFEALAHHCESLTGDDARVERIGQMFRKAMGQDFVYFGFAEDVPVDEACDSVLTRLLGEA